MSLQGLIKVFVAFKTQKECSANSLLCLVGVCFHSESSSSSNSRVSLVSPFQALHLLAILIKQPHQTLLTTNPVF